MLLGAFLLMCKWVNLQGAGAKLVHHRGEHQAAAVPSGEPQHSPRDRYL